MYGGMNGGAGKKAPAGMIAAWCEAQKKRQPGDLHTQEDSLPLLPPGPGGVHDSLLRRARLSKSNTEIKF